MSGSKSETGALISIILPVFNGERYLDQSIQSCLDQTYNNFELIIVNDCSTDNSLKIAESFKNFDGRIKIISNERNRKLPASLNIGHKAAKGEFYTWTSHDNIYENNAIEKLLEGIIKHNVDIVYADLNIIESNGSLRKSINPGDYTRLLFGNSIGAVFLYRKEVFYRNKGYDEKLHSIEDYDFWLRACEHSDFYHIHQVLYNYRIHDLTLSSKLRISDSRENRLYIQNLRRVYQQIIDNLGTANSKEFVDSFMNIHLYKSLDVLKFLKYYIDYLDFLSKVCLKMPALDFDRLKRELDIKLRSSILNNRNNQNFKVLCSILKVRPYMILGYEKKRSFQILQKCLFPRR
ncbi:glycosyltransferase family 2 protein [Salinimicrobium sediminilitoris]|uniref:glycosyltransferase family 2 protein n=1 Tax=Salinimicrobium sediminilitoris TaxID=2876715 RepID=UPI001E448BF2|nr:glycosyltransferase [Salinimicrobium sediminilitoris]